MSKTLPYAILVTVGYLISWFFFCVYRSRVYAPYGMTLKKYMRAGFPVAITYAVLIFLFAYFVLAK